MRIHFRDPLFDAQLLRALNNVYEQGADVGECLSTAARIAEADLDGWHREWSATAARIESLAASCLEGGHRESAREAYLRASTYHRTAGVFFIGSPADPRLGETHAAQTRCFARAAGLSGGAIQPVAIPYEGTTLPGYYLRARGEEPRPCVIVNGGYDGTAEECFFFSGAAAVRHGFHCLLFDGPGQGAVLVDQGLPTRPDWERVIGPVVDHLRARPDVIADEIALVGLSLGGYQALRAVCHERRLAACVVDPAQGDLCLTALRKLPLPFRMRDHFFTLPALAQALVGKLLLRVSRHPTRGWALRRGQHVHGVSSPLEYLRALRAYTTTDRLEQVGCPVLVCDAERDPLAAQAREVFEALGGPKEYARFSASQGAGDHCEAGNRSLCNEVVFDWLERNLRPPDGRPNPGT